MNKVSRVKTFGGLTHTHTDNTCVYFCVCIHEYMYVLCDIYRFLSIFKKFATATFALSLAWRQQQTFCPGHISSGTSSCQALVLSPSPSLYLSLSLCLCLSAAFRYILPERDSGTFFAKFFKALINFGYRLMSASNELILFPAALTP